MNQNFLIPLSLLAFTAALNASMAQAQEAANTSTQAASAVPAVSAEPAAIELEAVVVKTSGDRNDRCESTAAKIVVTREDLTRHGDTSVAEALNRVPGVTVSGSPGGRGGEVRMRGLGNGYTQILLNGEPTGSGFSLDSIAPNLIERIEVMRTATADLSAQAIAGTINIILKQVVRQAQKQVKTAVSGERGHPSVNIDGQFSDRAGALSYTLAGSLSSQQFVTPSTILRQGRDAQSLLTSERVTASVEDYRANSLSLTPRLNWTASERDTVVLDGLLSYRQSRYTSNDEQTMIFGSPPFYGNTEVQQHYDSSTLRGRATWTRALADAATLEIKLGGSSNRTQPVTHRMSVLPGQSVNVDALALERNVSSTATDNAVNLNGKYRAPYKETHAIAIGWDSEYSRRGDDRIQRDSISTAAPAENLDENYDADVRRLAFFAQDEWDVTPRWAAYSGLRWEGLATRSAGNDLSAVRNNSGVFSPILQSLWKVPDTQGDQVRIGISRTYKAPAMRDLIARRYRYYDNTPTSADSQGNPNLRPELAWGLDLAYERHFDDGGLLSANLFERRIQDVIMQELFIDNNGRWVTQPVNNGNAQVRGIELEAKLNLRKLLKTAPAVDLRANLARNWSILESVPGPDNRLNQQIPLSANLSADWRPDGTPLTLGGSFGFQQGGLVRYSSNQTTSSSIKRNLDAYGLWKIDAKTQLRISASNLLHQKYAEERIYSDTLGSALQASTTDTATTIRATLELKL